MDTFFCPIGVLIRGVPLYMPLCVYRNYALFRLPCLALAPLNLLPLSLSLSLSLSISPGRPTKERLRTFPGSWLHYVTYSGSPGYSGIQLEPIFMASFQELPFLLIQHSLLRILRWLLRNTMCMATDLGSGTISENQPFPVVQPYSELYKATVHAQPMYYQVVQ